MASVKDGRELRRRGEGERRRGTSRGRRKTRYLEPEAQEFFVNILWLQTLGIREGEGVGGREGGRGPGRKREKNQEEGASINAG
jgi:hypothetical protein